MIRNRLTKMVFGSTFVMTLLLPAMAYAAAVEDAGGEWQSHVGKALGASFAMGVSALSAGYAQSKIGPAAAGALAERPEVAVWVIVLQALPEIIVLLGFVAAILIVGMPVATSS